MLLWNKLSAGAYVLINFLQSKFGNKDHAMVINLFNVYREKETQTKSDAYTNVPKPSVFLEGLRGGGMTSKTNMVKVDLTQDVDQT